MNTLFYVYNCVPAKHKLTVTNFQCDLKVENWLWQRAVIFSFRYLFIYYFVFTSFILSGGWIRRKKKSYIKIGFVWLNWFIVAIVDFNLCQRNQSIDLFVKAKPQIMTIHTLMVLRNIYNIPFTYYLIFRNFLLIIGLIMESKIIINKWSNALMWQCAYNKKLNQNHSFRKMLSFNWKAIGMRCKTMNTTIKKNDKSIWKGDTEPINGGHLNKVKWNEEKKNYVAANKKINSMKKCAEIIRFLVCKACALYFERFHFHFA